MSKGRKKAADSQHIYTLTEPTVCVEVLFLNTA